MGPSNIPLVVDLDGTLTKTDLLIESFYAMFKSHPLAVFLVPFWMLRGKAYLKNRIAERSTVDVKVLPYNEKFLEYLRLEFEKGRPLVLATASVHKFASDIANHHGFFAEVFASNEQTNLSGKNKLNLLVDKYGEKGFDYAGNDTPDLHIFPHARAAILVNPSSTIESVAKKLGNVEHIFKDDPAGLFSYIMAMRVYQWIKNVLMFVPLIISHKFLGVCSGRKKTPTCAKSGRL